MIEPLAQTEMEKLLSANLIGHMACCEDNTPYLVPMVYLYHSNVIYGQTTEGRKTDILKNNPAVCFQVEKVTAVSWQSVICWGTYQELDFSKLENPEAIRLTKALSNRISRLQKELSDIRMYYEFSGKIEPVHVNGKIPVLFRIIISKMTGKKSVLR